MGRLIAAWLLSKKHQEKSDRDGIWNPGLGSPYHWIFYLTQESALSWVRCKMRKLCLVSSGKHWDQCLWEWASGQGWRWERAFVPCKPTPLMPCGSQHRTGASTWPWAEVCITLISTPGVRRLFLFCPFHRWECRGTEKSSILSEVTQLASLKWSELTWSHSRMFVQVSLFFCLLARCFSLWWVHKERKLFLFSVLLFEVDIITIHPLMAGKLLLNPSTIPGQLPQSIHLILPKPVPPYTRKSVLLLFIYLGTGLFHERILSTFFSTGFRRVPRVAPIYLPPK